MRWISKAIAVLLAPVWLLPLPARAAAESGTGASGRTNSPSDRLLLRNGDVLAGQLLSIDKRHVLRWKSPDVLEAIDFKADAAAQIEFDPPPGPERGTNYPCRVYLTDGDALEGNLVSYNGGSLSLQTWYAGQLKIPRKSLQGAYFLPTTPDVFELTGPEGWTQGSTAAVFPGDSGQWTYREGAFYANKAASIARDLKLPPSAAIQFDLAWSGYLTLSVALYTDSLQPILLASKDNGPAFGGFYSLQFHSESMAVDLARIKRMEPLTRLTPVLVPAMSQTNRIHVEVHARKQSNIISFSVDGQLLQTWTDTNGFVGEGTGMRFVHNGAGTIKLSNLRVAPWDGVWEAEAKNPPASGGDTVWMTNATSRSGDIQEIAGGKLILRGSRDKVDVPLSQLRRIEFAPKTSDAGKPPAGMVRGVFARGGSVAFQLESWGPEGVNVRSPVFGSARFNPAAFKRLEFLPDEGSPASTGASRTSD